jgi:hypothetical protein
MQLGRTSVIKFEKTWAVDTSWEGMSRLILGACLIIGGMADLLEFFDVRSWIAIKTVQNTLMIGAGLYLAFGRK